MNSRARTLKIIKQPKQLMFNSQQKIIPIIRKQTIQFEASESTTDSPSLRQQTKYVSLSNCQIKQNEYDLFKNINMLSKVKEDEYEKGIRELDASTQITQLKLFLTSYIIDLKSYLDSCAAFEYLLDKIQDQITIGQVNLDKIMKSHANKKQIVKNNNEHQ
ncbi:Hypothetical_protein [Hexamita inflata]|uniref:Hypothetical_protein n=1 Tax=Hexamita inflata TaxID=28002 RepID=A0AA86PDZ9_9EUKA|nr:Hypothetical protein HINF_LOCUS24949 [Hexamita inflata]